jgi:hypothetical protein
VRARVVALVVIGLLWSASDLAYADRPPEDRTTAVMVVEALVLMTDSVRAGHMEYYSTQLQVMKVMKGNIKPGERLLVTTFRMVGDPPFGVVGSTGHKPPPSDGQHILAYVSGRLKRDGYEGIYKNWFDLLPPAQSD